MPILPQSKLQEDARDLAACWHAMLNHPSATPARVVLRPDGKDLSIEALAEFVATAIQNGQTLLLVVPDDAWLPELSNALDIALRPLCLMLPRHDFSAGIALRATLALLKSRLSRSGDSTWRDAWDAQRSRLEEHDALWHLTLEWSSSGHSGNAWPSQIDELFPICILPLARALATTGSARDLLLILHPQRMAVDKAELAGLGNRHLLLEEAAAPATRGLAAVDEHARLSAEYEMLAQELGDMELEFATVQAELAEFTRAYHAQVGVRMTELDALHARIAKCHADRLSADATAQMQAQQAQAQAERSEREQIRFAELDGATERPFAPTTDLKRLFRQLAQKIHPDRAEDEDDRAWRSELMSEANRAYRAGDEMVLRDILCQWQAGRRVPPSAAITTPKGLAQQVWRMQRRLAEIEGELNRLLGSRLYELFVAAGMARQRGRDLLQEMVTQLEAQIDQARQRLAQLETA